MFYKVLKYGYPAVALSLVLALLLGAPVTQSPVTTLNAKSSNSGYYSSDSLLRQIRADAVAVKSDADVMKSLVRFPGDFHWLTHAWYLNQIKGRVNDMGKQMVRLRSSDAVSARGLTTLQGGLVGHTEAAIAFTQKRTFAKFWDASYKSHIDGIYRSANSIIGATKEFGTKKMASGTTKMATDFGVPDMVSE